ncbi:oxidoreductase [Aureimonas endophytica]|uniref:Oxidoreductase n=1 Tax=Aureimonas endophytica TaxID=2027858 RepID=A0A916ZTD1_9HYPH|nr:FAD-binding oxidoreductase [Aureimonas endophytica]GGE11639.1 oxidoreductase [Aureimonas endophytica]
MSSSLSPLPSLAELAAGFPADFLVADPDLAAGYGRDRTGDYAGTSFAVARPRSAEELAALVRRCAALGLGLVPQGGLTGLVGAAVPGEAPPEVVVSLDRMSAVRSLDPIGYTMVVEAGCVLETAKQAADAADLLLPITFGAQGSCRIGGNVSTNAGGFNVLRYGMTRDLVLGLEVVLPDGRIWNGLRTLRKDNRGYDLKQLFIGAEGTLGIVTAAALKLFPKPTQVETALIGLASVEEAMALYARARRSCSDLLSAFELILRDGLDLALAHRPELGDPLETRCPVYVLMELAAGGSVDLRAVLERALEEAGEHLLDGTIATSRAQADRLWFYREAMVEAQSRGGPYYRTDVSVPIAAIPAFLDSVLAELAGSLPEGRPITYGHVGDGNIHLNVVPPADWSREARKRLFAEAEEVIFTAVDRFAGSISAEHGIGRSKKRALMARIDPVTLDLMRGLKDMLDPDHRFSSGRIFDRRPAEPPAP